MRFSIYALILLAATLFVAPRARADKPAPRVLAPATKAPKAPPSAAVDADGAPLRLPDDKPTRDLVFKTTTDSTGREVQLKMHVFEPRGHRATDKNPVLVFFHGGGWNDGSPRSFYPHCAYFAARGMVAVAPEYRVKNRQKTTPYQSVADGKSAIRYLRAHAAELGIDPQRIVAAGSSAGGHIAACTALLRGFDEKSEDAAISSAPNALALYNPVIDTSKAGYGNARLGDRWREISPLHNVRRGLPPTILFHGDADKTVPYANAVAFEKAMRDAGNRCQLVTLHGVGHGFVYNLKNKAARTAVRETDVFLRSLGYLHGEPTIE